MDIIDRLMTFGPERTAEHTGRIVPYEVCVRAAEEIERLRAALQNCRMFFDANNRPNHVEMIDKALGS